ncbi:MAG: outer membrane lipoprotein-sorting protein [Desulfobacterales bacterium]
MLVLTCTLVHAASAKARDFATAQEIVDLGFEYLRENTSYAVVEMVIHRPDWERRMVMRGWTRGEDESLIKIIAPSKDKGNGTLKIGREMWIYNPKINRVIKVPPSMMSQSWMGSDFSNNDLAKSDTLIKDYVHEIVGTESHDGKNVYVIRSMPKPHAPVVWGMLELRIREDLIFLSEEFFDEDLESVKIMFGREIQEMGGKLFPKEWIMQKTGAEEEYTKLTYDTIEFNVELENNLFSISSLKNPIR